MNKILYPLMVICFLLSTVYSQDLVRKTKSQVEFAELGSYRVENVTYVSNDQKRADEKTKFKGKGFIKGTIAKLLLRSGETGQLHQPTQKRIVYFDHKDKKYWIEDMMTVEMEDWRTDDESTQDPDSLEEDDQADARESDIEIIRSVFKVTKEDEQKKINGFDCGQYSVLWVTEWRNKVTEETGTDSLYTLVWSTPYSEELRACTEKEMAFTKVQMGAMGIDVEALQREMVLGLNWMKIMAQANQQDRQSSNPDSPQWVEELKKLEGYPIVVDGKYYAIRPKPETEQAEESSDITDVKGKLGGFMKKKIFGKKKEPQGLQPVLTYLTEIQQYGLKDVGSEPYQIPGNYKEKKK